MQGLIALIFLSTVCLIETQEIPHLISTIERKTGDTVTFSCQSIEEHRFHQWYKQSPGKMIQTVGSGVYDTITQQKPFNNTRFNLHREKDVISLTIHSVNKEDEAVYFCQSGTEFLQTFIKGFLLVVKECNQQMSVFLKQTPETASVQPGDTMSLQCSLFSRNNETRPQCPGKNFVHWFTARSGSSYPSIIYTARNSTDDVMRRSCVYHISKTVEDSSDFGTYYCAVAICGEILLGDGSKLESKQESSVRVLGGLLVCCVFVIVCLIIYILGKNISDNSRGIRGMHHVKHETTTTYVSRDLGGEKNVTYATTLDFSATNVRQCNKREDNTECLYSSVREDSK